MILIDFSLAVTIFICVVLALVFGRWIIYTYNNSDQMVLLEQKEELVICPYCTHIFFDYHKGKVKICPRCESYIALEEIKKEVK